MSGAKKADGQDVMFVGGGTLARGLDRNFIGVKYIIRMMKDEEWTEFYKLQLTDGWTKDKIFIRRKL